MAPLNYLLSVTTADFLDPGELSDGDLSLVLAGVYPSDARQVVVPYYRFTMMQRPRNLPVGYITLRIATDLDTILYWGHVGYAVEPAFRGHHYAARSLQLLVPLARRHGIDPIWITSNPGNIASRRSCEVAGATLVDTVDIPAGHPLRARGDEQKCRYRL